MPSFYEFFAGGGMVREALGANWDCLFANDIDPKKSETYKANFGGAELVTADVADLTADQLPGLPDMVWASFPCQDLSLAGSGAGLSGARSGAFWSFWKLVQGLARQGRKPATVVLENVYGLLTSRDGNDFRSICEAVANEGYHVGAVLLDAALFVPQSRPRLFIVAIDQAKDVGLLTLGGPPTSPLFPSKLIAARNGLKGGAADAWQWWAVSEPNVRNVGLVDVIEGEPTGVNWHTKEQTARLLALMSPGHLKKVEDAKASTQRQIGTVFKRTRPSPTGGKAQRAEVRFDGLAGCLRTPGGGSSRQTIIVVEGGKVRSRLLSPRETARLMGLPDGYKLPDRYNDALHLTGDGVVVPVVRHLAHTLIEPALAIKSTRDEAA